jgi:predicted GNAT family acetyltransferase
MPDPVIPIHEPDRERFCVSEDGELAAVDYRLRDGVMVITHTRVPKAIEGRGIAGALVRTALDFARAQGWRVRPACSYADAWMRRHPDYDTLRTA